MADSKKYNGSTWEHSLRELGTATDTFTTFPVDIYADGNNATVGISGNTVQSGTPTPDNPIMPQGTGERTGNLFDKNATNVNNGYITNGFLQSDGSITTDIAYRVSEYIRIAQNQSYTLFYGSNLNFPSVCFYDSAKNYISGVAYASRWNVPFTTPQNAEYLRLSFGAVDHSRIMLNAGSTALPYQPYGYKIPISSASTTTPVYLGDVETTRRIKKYVFTGNENFMRTSAGYFYAQNSFEDYNSSLYGVVSTVFSHYEATINSVNGNLLANSQACLYAIQTVTPYKEVYIRDTRFATADEFNSYLAAQYAAGTPVTVWYVLATEETAVVNEPLRKIGDYADTVSDITVPTITGKDTFDVDTTLKPSEASLNYTGWHDATVQEWDGAQWNQ